MNSFAVSVSPFSHVWRVLYEMATSLARLFCLILLVVGRCCRVPSDRRNAQECRSISDPSWEPVSPSRLILPSAPTCMALPCQRASGSLTRTSCSH